MEEKDKEYGEQFAFASIEDFENIVGYKVNDIFKDGWRMARTTNKQLGITEPDE